MELLTPKNNKTVAGILHVPQNYHREQSEGREKTAAILLSGAGGGLVGPSSVYLSIADKVASLNRGIPVLRLDYRYPARNKYCVPDVVAAMNYLQNGYAVSRFVLVGWSYGGAPVFTAGGQDDRVVGCATVASQTAETVCNSSLLPLLHDRLPFEALFRLGFSIFHPPITHAGEPFFCTSVESDIDYVQDRKPLLSALFYEIKLE